VTRKDKPPAKLTEAMRTGDEPLRSFGDLMAFFKDTKEEAPAPELPTDKVATPASTTSSESTGTPESASASEPIAAEPKTPQMVVTDTDNSKGPESNATSEGGSDTVSSTGPAESERTP